ncbi:MAG: Kelch repeat-containing protein [Planctomycetota bacterium]|jgi:N-acetylneuraminic acid mutarotase
MKKTISLILLLALGLASVSLAAEGTWTQKTDMPTPRYLLSASAVNGKIYAIGGVSSEPSLEGLSTVEEYDPATDTWARKADMPTARVALSTSVVSGKIYAIGGNPSVYWSGLSIVEVYDPATDTWTPKADMPTGRSLLSTCVVDGKIYAIGGTVGSTASTVQGLTIVEEYDPATDTWIRKADMPTGVWGPSASVVDGRIYVMGGASRIDAKRTVQEYDPTTDTWMRKADMMTPRRNFGTSVLCGKIYAIGGWLGSTHTPYSTVEMYDPKLDLWTQIEDLPVRKAGLSTNVLGGRIYAIGGTSRPHPIPATSTVYELTVGFPPDFNADFKIDIEDLIILIEHWGRDEPSVDIAPPPCGDGIVDVQDLEILMSYWGQEVYDPTLIAHWKLDETEGNIVHDSSFVGNDATVNGEPVWQPTGGAVDGALQFDGIDDYVSTPYVLNPADGAFSVFAWIKGGAPGQTVISQAGGLVGVNWLLADPLQGNLMTELKGPGRSSAVLLSQTVVTDGNWHRIGFVWDGSNRMLYVDDVEVATDTQGSLEGSTLGGLHIGAGNTLEPGSFLSGLIDDVRIYDRAITP